MDTGQFERATTEGSPFFQPGALYSTGRVDEAFDLARAQAISGNPGNLFDLLVRAGRYQELVDYVEERWPSLSTFASEYPGGQNGYNFMADIALAYSHTDNMARFDEAMRFVDQRISSLAEQGISNFVFSGNRAVYYAQLGDIDAAFDHLQSAVEGGWVIVGDPVEVEPALAALENDPRFTEIEATMLARVNEYRGLLDLAPFDENYQVLQQPAM
jgi:tetratricopeptide (TPR) repeat protein